MCAKNIHPPPWRQWRVLKFIFQRLAICKRFLHAYSEFKSSTPNYKVSFSYPYLWQLCHIKRVTQRIFTFHSKFKDEWPPHSPDLNPIDYYEWGAMLQAFHKLNPKPKTIPELKSALQQISDDLPQTTINKAVYDFRERLNASVSTGGGHFEHQI